MKRPHVIIINPDQMRADALHHLGNPAAVTPNLDAAAQTDAVSFSQAFCQNPICTPSRCSFFSGLYPHVFGHRTISFMQYEQEPSLLRTMKEQGYHVWMNDRNDFLPAQVPGVFTRYCDEYYVPADLSPLPPPVVPNHRGLPGSDTYYSFYVGELKTDGDGRYYDSDASCVAALKRRILSHDGEKPLCAFLGLLAPHPPYGVEAPYFQSIDRNRLPKRVKISDDANKSDMLMGLRALYGMKDWTEDRFDELRATYLGMCMKVDAFYGEIVSALKTAGMYEDTLLVFLSDHGDYTGDYDVVEKAQNTFEDCITNVPLLIKPPKWARVSPGTTPALTELVDFYATVLDYGQLQAPETHFGNSLRPVIENRHVENRTFVCCEGGRRRDEAHCNSAAKNAGPENPYYPRFQMQGRDACVKGTMIRDRQFKYIYRAEGQDELYDLIKDPKEVENLAGREAYAEEVLQRKMKLLSWYQSTCDLVPQKPDQRMNTAMQLSKLSTRLPPETLTKVKTRVGAGESLEAVLQALT